MLIVAVLNGLDLQAEDTKNTYITAPRCENIWIREGPECSIDKGKVYMVVRALYSLKSSGAAFRVFLTEI